MSKFSILFSVALGGLVLVGCNKEESNSPTTTPSTTPPAVTSTTGPTVTTPTITPPTLPTTVPSASDINNAVKGAGDALKGAAKSTTEPSTPGGTDSK